MRLDEWTEEAGQLAADAGRIDWLQQLAQHHPVGMWPASICSTTAAGGQKQLPALKWLRSQDPPCPWDASACTAAAKDGHMGVLQWLHNQQPPCPWNETTSAAAAGEGREDILQWLRSQHPPCPWDQTSCDAAIHGGYIHTLSWLCSQHPPCPSQQSPAEISCMQEMRPQDWLPSQPSASPRHHAAVPAASESHSCASKAEQSECEECAAFACEAFDGQIWREDGALDLDSPYCDLHEEVYEHDPSKTSAYMLQQRVQQAVQALGEDPARAWQMNAHKRAAAAGREDVLMWLHGVCQETKPYSPFRHYILASLAAHEGMVHSRPEVVDWAVRHEPRIRKRVLVKLSYSRNQHLLEYLLSRGSLPAEICSSPSLKSATLMGDAFTFEAIWEGHMRLAGRDALTPLFTAAFQALHDFMEPIAQTPQGLDAIQTAGMASDYWLNASTNPNYMATAALLMRELCGIDSMTGSRM